jgi:hypothetical protein
LKTGAPKAKPASARQGKARRHEGLEMPEIPSDDGHHHPWSWWYLLLLLQFVPALWVPLYNSAEPSVGGIPFFYWFQLALVLVSAVVTAIVYFATARSA